MVKTQTIGKEAEDLQLFLKKKSVSKRTSSAADGLFTKSGRLLRKDGRLFTRSDHL